MQNKKSSICTMWNIKQTIIPRLKTNTSIKGEAFSPKFGHICLSACFKFQDKMYYNLCPSFFDDVTMQTSNEIYTL